MKFIEVKDLESWRRQVLQKLPQRFEDRWKSGLYEQIRHVGTAEGNAAQ